jgi:hypothetical protein
MPRIPALLITAAALAPAWATAQDAGLGRLFHTPQQRAELDKRRIAPAPAPKEEPAAPAAQEVNVTVNGYVTRSSGKTTAWVNGVPQNDKMKSADPARVPVEAADGQRRVKVGATIDTNRGDVRDVVDGQIRVNPPRP